MEFWRNNVDQILISNGLSLINSKGTISNKEMEAFVEHIYEEFDTKRRKEEAEEADVQDLNELSELEQRIKSRKK